MVLGEHGFQSGEGRSRTDIGLPGVQQELLEEIFKVNKNIVLVLNNGRPLAISWADENIPAIVEAWQLGTQSGNAIAEVLYGDYNPSGKLPMTFPRNVGQVPLYYNYKNTGRPNSPGPESVFWSHYNDEENTPLYPFGYGLSYTTFDYGTIKTTNSFDLDQKITVSVVITNTGKRKGKEVVQLYIRDKYASITRPVKELKGFELLELLPGEKKIVDFELTEKELGFYDNDGEWILEKGDFEIFIGGNSQTNNKTTLELK
jgi:beta-glucosidase